jgi:LacI family transcriptional regulator
MDGYIKALYDKGFGDHDIISCAGNSKNNYQVIRELLKKENRPDGLIASVEKLTTPIYLACKDLGLSIPNDIKVISFTNLQAALILTPTLTTVTQPAFEMGKAAADVLFKSLEKSNFNLKKEITVIPSVLHVRNSVL